MDFLTLPFDVLYTIFECLPLVSKIDLSSCSRKLSNLLQPKIYEDADYRIPKFIYNFFLIGSVKLTQIRHVVGLSNIQFLNYLLNLETLTFSDTYLECIDTLPPKLKLIEFGKCFNHPIESLDWPVNLEHIKFGWSFDQPIEQCRWPPNLKYFRFGNGFNYPIENSIFPDTLISLHFDYYFNCPIEKLKFPKSLEGLEFGSMWDQPIELAKLPSLKWIIFGADFDQPLHNLPDSLISLSFGHHFNSSITLPPNLEFLQFGSTFNQFIPKWPQKLKHLYFSKEYNQLTVDLPDSLVILEFGKNFNQPILKLPANLKILRFGTHWNQPIKHLTFPQSLEEIVFGKAFVPDDLVFLENLPVKNIKLYFNDSD